MVFIYRGIAQHFAMSCGATSSHRGFDGTRVIVLGAMVPWLMMVDGGWWWQMVVVYCTNHFVI